MGFLNHLEEDWQIRV